MNKAIEQNRKALLRKAEEMMNEHLEEMESERKRAERAADVIEKMRHQRNAEYAVGFADAAEILLNEMQIAFGERGFSPNDQKYHRVANVNSDS